MAVRCPAGGVPVNPEVSKEFWSYTPKANRSKDDLAWWGKPFIQTVPNPNFPKGIRYDVYCLEDGSTLDRPAVWGMFGTMEEAVQRAQDGPPRRPEASRIGGERSDGGW